MKNTKCKNGIELSIQANANGAYCLPKEDRGYWSNYDRVEVDAKDQKTNEPLDLPSSWKQYLCTATKEIYAYVPTQLVNELVDKNGGAVHEEKSMLAIVKIKKDNAGKPISYTIESKNPLYGNVDVLNTIRNRIFFGGNPKYDGREGGTLKFKFTSL